MSNPVHSAFTVTVDFKGTIYDVEIKPTLNGQPIEWLQDRVDQWNSAQSTHQLFSRKIVEMLNNTNFPADYSLETHGVITGGSVIGFTFDKGLEITHTTQNIWEEFIECLKDPVSQTAGRDPVDHVPEVLGNRLGAEFTCIPNAYLNLDADQQKAVRLYLFQAKCYEYFAHVSGLELPRELTEYTPPAKACLAHLLYSNPSSPKLTPDKEAKSIWMMQSKAERDQMAPFVKRIREQVVEKIAAQLEVDADDSVSEIAFSDSDVSLSSQSGTLEDIVFSEEEASGSASRKRHLNSASSSYSDILSESGEGLA